MAAWKNRRNPGQPNFLQGRRSNRCRRETEAKTSKDIPAALHRDVIYSQSAFLNDKGSLGRLTKAHTVGRHIRTVCGVRSPLVYNNAAGSEPGPPPRSLRHRMSSLGPGADLHRARPPPGILLLASDRRSFAHKICSRHIVMPRCDDITAGDRQRPPSPLFHRRRIRRVSDPRREIRVGRILFVSRDACLNIV